LLALLQKKKNMNRPDVTVHGFRTTFSTWVRVCTAYSEELSKLARAHAVGDKVQRAYDRSDALERRRRLMDDWAAYCIGGKAASGKVIPIRKRA
jgi:hypothetical protein